MNKKELLDRCARNGEERILLARVLDKLEWTQNRDVPAHTPFLSPGEQAAVRALLHAWGNPPHSFWGGFPGAERAVCCFRPGWQSEEDLQSAPDGPLAALEVRLPQNAAPGHRDVLGSLMGLGLSREKLGDILLPETGRCQLVALRQTLPVLLSQWEEISRWHIRPLEIPLSQLEPQPAQVKTIQDTVASPRLDAVLGAAFSLSRAKAAACIASGKVAVNHAECLKGDRTVQEGDVLTCRGLGKCVVREIPGQSKKGRTRLTIDRYL